MCQNKQINTEHWATSVVHSVEAVATDIEKEKNTNKAIFTLRIAIHATNNSAT